MERKMERKKAVMPRWPIRSLQLFCPEHLLKPIFVAIVVFSPVSWFAMNWWLQFSEYLISLDPGVLLLSWMAILLISRLTVGAQTVRAAMVNPVDSLKSE